MIQLINRAVRKHFEMNIICDPKVNRKTKNHNSINEKMTKLCLNGEIQNYTTKRD